LLYNYFKEYEESTGGKIELDVIGICCEYEETHFMDVIASYSDCSNEDETINDAITYLQDSTQYIGQVGDSLVFASF
jgi:hypothetical protein